MVKPNRNNRKLNRRSDMDDALSEALASSVPDKNTGPDPDDILMGIFEDDNAGSMQSGKVRDIVVALDEIDRQHAQQIMELVRQQTGEQIELAQAIKIALSLCPMNDEKIEVAYAKTRTSKRTD